MEGGTAARLSAMLLAFPVGKRLFLLIHKDVMTAGFAGAKTCHAPYLGSPWKVEM
jgi:hypothetical protein